MGLFEKKHDNSNIISDTTPSEQTPVQSNDIQSIFKDVIAFCSRPDKNYLTNIQRGILKKEQFLNIVQKYLEAKGYSGPVIKEVTEMITKYIWGYYIIDDYINDDSISDIKILDESHIRLKINGKRVTADRKFIDKDDYLHFVEMMCSRNGVSLSDMNAIQYFTDREGSDKAILRFNICSGFINLTESPYVHIRKTLKNKKDLSRLVADDMLPQDVADYLAEQVRTSSGIVFTGKGASGKTTLMNALIDEIPWENSGLVIQESDELFSNKHPDMMFQHVVMNRGEGRISYSLRDLATNGLLTDLDYFIIGEIKGGEALYFLNAAYTGHKCWCSVHGANSKEAIAKLSDYVKYESDYTKGDVMAMLRFLEVVIFMEDYKVMEISKVAGYNQETKNLEFVTIYDRKEGINNVKQAC